MKSRAFSANQIALMGFLLLAALAASQLTPRADRNGALFEGVPVARWVSRALGEEPQSTNAGVVLRIGSPAVPYLIEGLKDKSHNPFMRRVEWIRQHLPSRLQRARSEPCVLQHKKALTLLGQLGEKAHPAVPAIIRCFETCPDQHYVDGLECLEVLGDIGHAATNAVFFLTKLARGQNSYSIRAAATEFFITDRTNLVVETVVRLAESDPEQVVSAREIFWFRADAGLNQVFVPLFVQLLFDSRLSDDDRQSVVFELRSRGVESFAAIPFQMQALASTTSVELRSDIVATFPSILGLFTGQEKSEVSQATDSEYDPDFKADATDGSSKPHNELRRGH